jgi:ComF family protein
MPAPAAAVAHAAYRRMLDFALPPRCPGCGAIALEPHRFCLACWRSLTFLGDPCCACCGLPFAYAGGDGALCGRCLAEPPPFDRLRAAVAYGDVSREVALKLKYSGRLGLAETLAHFMLRHVRSGERRSGEGEAILVPVPLHRWRIWKRGYNQAALIASALARRTGLPAGLDLLVRTRATPPLRGLGRRERALAVRGAFKVPPGARPRLAGRPVLLVDDVYTSGATATACARALKRSGAASVEILCWARVVPVDGA